MTSKLRRGGWEKAAAEVPPRARRLWDSSQSRVTSKLRRGGWEKAAAEVPPRARDEEKAAAEVPSHASMPKQAGTGDIDSLTAVVEFEECREIPLYTTPCDGTARVVGGA